MRRRLPSRRIALPLLAAWLLGALAVVTLVSATARPDRSAAQATASAPDAAVLRTKGKALFAEGCASCHALDGTGVAHRGPKLVGVGAAAVDFYVSTGRMPLERPGIEPRRSPPAYDRDDTAALVAYVTALGPGGPAIPRVVPAQGDLADGRRLFADNCSGCHQIVAKGGAAPGFSAPSLDEASPTQIGEAIRVGPYLMPRFSTALLDQHDVDSIARFVTESTRELTRTLRATIDEILTARGDDGSVASVLRAIKSPG
ncbi:c-type cytochrome, partial [Patulibacter sp. S7RM1-6]